MRFTSLAPFQCFLGRSSSSIDSPRAVYPHLPGIWGRVVRSVTHSHARVRALVDCNPPIPFRCPTSCGDFPMLSPPLIIFRTYSAKMPMTKHGSNCNLSIIMAFRFAVKYKYRKKNYGSGLRWKDHVLFPYCDFEIDRPMSEDSRVSATLMKMNCVQFRQSVRPNRTVSCLGTNMKKYATRKNRMCHSLHPRLCEHSSTWNYTLIAYCDKSNWYCCWPW